MTWQQQLWQCKHSELGCTCGHVLCDAKQEATCHWPDGEVSYVRPCNLPKDGVTQHCVFATAGDYFGELALLPGGTTRAATVRARSDVSLLVLDRDHFEKLLGPLLPQLEAAAKNYSGYRPNKQGVQELNLSEVEHIATLGAGGFGRVTLVKYGGASYALKQMSKGHIVDNKLVAHVHREKKVSSVCSVL